MIGIKTISKLFLFVLMFTACTKDGTIGPEGPSLSGDLVGFANLYNVAGVRLADNSGIIVTAYPDTLASPGKKYIDTTTVDGRFLLPQLSTGTYTITFSKKGYGARKLSGYQFVGGGQVSYGTTSISAISTSTVTSLSATVSALTSYVTFNGTLSVNLPASYRYVRLFIGTSSGVSSLPVDYKFVQSTFINTTSTTFTSLVSSETLASYGMTTGQKLYVVAYADSYNGTSYLDMATGQYFYTSLNSTPSNVVSFVAP